LSSHVALDRTRGGALSVARPGANGLLTVGLAAILCAVAFVADGGLSLGRTTPVEMGLLLGGGLAVSGALVLAPRREHAWGIVPVGLFVVLAALTAVSVTWAANPSDAWTEANRTLTYATVFAAAAALAHVVPGRWNAVLGAITLSAVAISAYAVLTKVLPGALNPSEIYSRLSEPFGYWNSVGLAAALGVPGCLWLGARRWGHQGVSALAYPALGLLVLTIMLAYSRGALAAAVLGVAFWFATVPLRLRGAAVLIVGSCGGALMAAWALSQDTLTSDRVPVELRTQAGHQLGLLVVVMLGLLTLAGLAVNFALAGHRPHPRTRRRVGTGLLVALALVPVGVGIALAARPQGLGGSISDAWTSLTDPNARIPSNDPSRLTAAGSVRARYWNEALQIFEDNPVKGVGADGFATVRKRYRTADGAVRHAHGYVVQTLADLGILGLLASLALAGAWLVSAARATGLRRRDRGSPFPAERIGLLTLAAIVLVFAAHSLVDWTWFVPANAIVAIIAAGWIAGRGPLAAREDPSPPPRVGFAERVRAGFGERPRAIAATTVVVIALIAAWTAWQPLRAVNAGQDAIVSLERGDGARARSQALAAHHRNPLSIDPLIQLSTIESVQGRKNEARRALEQAVRLQPANPQSWLALAHFELDDLDRPAVALTAIRPALYLDPRSSDAVAVFLAAKRRAGSSQ
jgi:tetratricopeptide (TPR) repeat protein